MPTIDRAYRAILTEHIDIALAESEFIDTQGDRRRGLNTRRPARIVGYQLESEWLPFGERWDLRENRSTVYMQQQRSDGTWGQTQHRAVSYDAGPALASRVRPDDEPGRDLVSGRFGSMHNPVNSRNRRPVMGDIGEPLRHIELEPLEAPEPVSVPVPEPEKVPA